VSGRAIHRLTAIGLGALLVASSLRRGRRRPITQAAIAAALVAVTNAPLGLRPPTLWGGLRVGAVAGSIVALGVAATTALPGVRARMAQRTPPESPAAWLLVRIPLGTVWSEEASYRAALATLAADGFGPRGGQLLQATAFGLSHIADARATGEPIVGTVLATGVAGWVFGWLAQRSGSLAAPMLAHLATNEAGAIAALAVQAGTRV
jgi:membrane protease YdiL (CAAX protease family)